MKKGLLGAAGTVIGAGAATLATGVLVERRVGRQRRRAMPDADRLVALRSSPVEVTAEDGVRLHAEVDEPDPGSPPGPTVVFAHGYALNLDCWHFQRATFHGRRRMVFYDQRSHGRSGRSTDDNATVDQLGRDLLTVLDALVPEGPAVLVGHSMGGMAIMALAEQHPELFGDRVAGVGLLSTAADGMRPHRVLSPLIPDRIGGQAGPRLVAALALAPQLVETVRRRGSNIGYLVTDQLAFGADVPPAYVEFVNEMIAATPFEVLAQFFPQFDALDKVSVLAALDRVPTTVVCGTKDVLTSVRHSRKLAATVAGARLLELPDAGHMVILERKEEVNRALEDLFSDAEQVVASRAS
jgi:pimeloyl-ACP methyl ester carboxylesterase